MTLTADAAWINDAQRVFPVVIDPVLTKGVVNTAIRDTHVTSLLGNTNYIDYTRVYAGKTIFERARTYVQFDLPTLPNDSIITSARFDISKVATSLSNFNLLAYDCYQLSPWNPKNITWNNQPISTSANSCRNRSDLPLLSSDSGATLGSTVYRLDITSAVERWYAGGKNNGIVITTQDENALGQIDLFSANYSSASERPVLTINYFDGSALPQTESELLTEALLGLNDSEITKKFIRAYLLEPILSYDLGTLII